MIEFSKIKDYFTIEKYKFFLVKDYVMGFNYLVDWGTANFLFGRINCYDKRTSDCSHNYTYLDSCGFLTSFIQSKENPEISIMVRTTGDDWHFCNFYSHMFKKRIMEYQKELREGTDPQNRPKTKEELKEGRTIRIIGCYKNFEEAKKDSLKLQEQIGVNNKSCIPEDKVITRRSNNHHQISKEK